MKRYVVGMSIGIATALCFDLFGGCVPSEPARDGGSDGDADHDSGPPCAQDEDCDDGVFCNGAERCDPTAVGADVRGCDSGLPRCLDGQHCEESERACLTDCDLNSDADGDGASAINCGGHDCDDSDTRRYPNNVEQCDPVGLDEDCNPATLGQDADGDGYVSDQCCNLQRDGSLLCGEDCDDESIGINPGAPEVCDEFPDNNCDGDNLYDEDGDGHDARSCGGTDCDDGDPEIHPGAAERCGDSIDENCDGFANDRDCDGHDDVAHDIEGCDDCDDCDDTDAEIHPGAMERCNALDDDCDGRVPEPEDRDHDGFHNCTDGPAERRDCDDDDADRHPGNPEICDDGVDQDCSGEVDDRPCWIPVLAGSFEMGSPPDELGRQTNEGQHEVILTHDFLLMSTEVTQRRFAALMGYDPSRFTETPDHPVETVTWHEAEAFCNALSDAEGLDRCYECAGVEEGLSCETVHDTPYECPGYRLPTEAEWEYAARAGTTAATYRGDLTDVVCSPSVETIAWYTCNSELHTRSVGSLGPNAWGFHDMLGNVFEWVFELYDEYPAAVVIDPFGPPDGTHRMSRGGSYLMDAESIRAAARSRHLVSALPRTAGTGFRPARSLP